MTRPGYVLCNGGIMTRIECIIQRFEEENAKKFDLTLSNNIFYPSHPNKDMPLYARYKDANVEYYFRCYIANFCYRLLDTGYDLDENNKFVKVRK